MKNDEKQTIHYTTKNVNKAMKRNINRFLEDFCFQLTKEELNTMWFQNGTTYEKNYFTIQSLVDTFQATYLPGKDKP